MVPVTVSCFYSTQLPSLRDDRGWRNAISQDAEASEITTKDLEGFLELRQNQLEILRTPNFQNYEGSFCLGKWEKQSNWKYDTD